MVDYFSYVFFYILIYYIKQFASNCMQCNTGYLYRDLAEVSTILGIKKLQDVRAKCEQCVSDQFTSERGIGYWFCQRFRTSPESKIYDNQVLFPKKRNSTDIRNFISNFQFEILYSEIPCPIVRVYRLKIRVQNRR